MRGRRVTVKDDYSDYIIYYPYPCYKLPPIGLDIPDSGCQTVSIDIGIKNFAISIEKRYRTGCVDHIYFDKIDFTKYGNTNERSGTAVVDPRILNAINDFLDTLLPTIKMSRIIGLERQMAINYKSSQVFSHLRSYFMIHVKNFPNPCIIMDISAKLKGKMLGAPKGLTYTALKEWSIQKCRDLLTWRNDIDGLKVMNKHQGRSKTKADDLADAVTQMEAWFILNKGIVTQEPVELLLINSDDSHPKTVIQSSSTPVVNQPVFDLSTYIKPKTDFNNKHDLINK